jgi:AraC-like DNA-binding protein
MGDHMLKMHVGPSVRGTCGLGRRFLYGDGDLEVALEAGFAHQSHLARCMRRVLGVTPAQLVRQG